MLLNLEANPGRRSASRSNWIEATFREASDVPKMTWAGQILALPSLSPCTSVQLRTSHRDQHRGLRRHRKTSISFTKMKVILNFSILGIFSANSALKQPFRLKVSYENHTSAPYVIVIPSSEPALDHQIRNQCDFRQRGHGVIATEDSFFVEFAERSNISPCLYFAL